ncbi:hypothetical protein [Arthrobacter oryzae]|uniref:hypothetical protein n=1 Tax=Arthrobacter oryzae TaxID=409290 RepID=UPI0027875655|nr:hypothetical protein [Arthrobacter oryzae]MDQ0079079.1 hypothetical protein [Arthrobacter oryzae]
MPFDFGEIAGLITRLDIVMEPPVLSDERLGSLIVDGWRSPTFKLSFGGSDVACL